MPSNKSNNNVSNEFDQQKKKVCILGSTGSIGYSTLDVINRNSYQFSVYALVADSSVDLMVKQIYQYKPKYVVMNNELAYKKLKEIMRDDCVDTEIQYGISFILERVSDPEVDIVVSAIVGINGLKPTMRAIEHGKTILLANKESIVTAGNILINKAKSSGAIILPIDSEHNAIFQCMSSNISFSSQEYDINHIILTASGGPFLEYTYDELENITPEQACNHPNWKMGKKISVDSATMVNKALEYIEASFLFGLSSEQIKIAIHPQSIVHSIICYKDGSMIAQMSKSDMKVAIANVLAWPKRIHSGVSHLTLNELCTMRFSEACFKRFKALSIAKECIKRQDSSLVVFNAANEISVDAFLKKKIKFNRIIEVIEQTMSGVDQKEINVLDDVFLFNDIAQNYAQNYIKSL